MNPTLSASSVVIDDNADLGVLKRSPHELSTKKKAVEARLIVDRQHVKQIKESLAKGNMLCESMITCVNSFESRLDRLQTAVLPIYKDTVTLMKKQENVADVLKCLDDIMMYYHLAEQETVVKRGIHQFGDFESYMATVNQVLAARNFFAKERPDSDEHRSMAEVAMSGTDKLTELFRTHAKSMANCYSEDDMGLLRSGDVNEGVIEQVANNQLNEECKAVISRIACWLHGKAQDDSFATTYGKARISTVERSLACYRPKGVPMFSQTQDKKAHTLTSRNSFMHHEARPKSAASKFLKVGGGSKEGRNTPRMPEEDTISETGSALSGTGGDTRKTRAGQPVAMPTSLDDACAYYSLYCRTFIQLLKVEKAILHMVIPELLHKSVLDKVVSSSVQCLVSDGEKFSDQVRQAVTERHNFMAIMAVLRCSNLFYQISPQLIATFKGLESDPASKIAGLKHYFNGTLYGSIRQLLESVTSVTPDKHSNMPEDGTVHETTSNTVQLLQKMTEFKESVGRVILKHEPNQYVESLSPATLACNTYYAKIMKGLLSSIELKAKSYDNDTLQAIFKLNNFVYMQKHSGKGTEVAAATLSVWPEYIDELHHSIQKQHKIYQKCFNKLIAALSDMSLTLFKSSADIPKTSKSALKDRFKIINNELDEIHRVQERYSVPDIALRETLMQGNVDLVVPKYNEFLQAHAKIPFSKTPEKHILYNLEGCEKLLRSFFDMSA